MTFDPNIDEGIAKRLLLHAGEHRAGSAPTTHPDEDDLALFVEGGNGYTRSRSSTFTP